MERYFVITKEDDVETIVNHLANIRPRLGFEDIDDLIKYGHLCDWMLFVLVVE